MILLVVRVRFGNHGNYIGISVGELVELSLNPEKWKVWNPFSRRTE
jgi:hypothetical protein